MPSTGKFTHDLVNELRLRRWARQHFVPAGERDPRWPPAVLDEMRCKDAELLETSEQLSAGQRIVPLAPDTGWTLALDSAHAAPAAPQMLLRVPALDAR